MLNQCTTNHLCRKDKSRFVAGWEEDEGATWSHVAEDNSTASPCPELLRAADGIHSMLSVLGSSLDLVLHTAVWRALAQAINRAFYNEVATEALFSPQGACLFEADVGAIVAVFGLWSANPAAHFKESLEACR